MFDATGKVSELGFHWPSELEDECPLRGEWGIRARGVCLCYHSVLLITHCLTSVAYYKRRITMKGMEYQKQTVEFPWSFAGVFVEFW